MKALLVLSVALLLVGCAPDDTLHGDLAFSEAERAEIEAAADDMATWTGEPRIHFIWDGDVGEDEPRIVRQMPPRSPSDPPGVLQGKFIIPAGGERTIYVRPGLPLERLRHVVEHELGHNYGLCHLKDGERGVMAKSTSGTWSTADVAECRRVLGSCPDTASR